MQTRTDKRDDGERSFLRLLPEKNKDCRFNRKTAGAMNAVSLLEAKAMKYYFNRSVVAMLLISALWISSFASLSLAQAPKGDANKTETTPTQTTKSNTENKTPISTQASKSPLKDTENPALIGKRNINKGFGWFRGSLEKEMMWGRQLAAEVESQSKLIDDPIITEYVNRVGQNLVLHSDAKVPFTIKVIDSEEVNAFALPGGFFYVNKGLLLAADNEAELAGVMAHEIGHVAARHAAENYGKMQAFSIGLLAGMILTGGVAGTVLQNTGGLLQGLTYLKFSRGAEVEADSLGTQYLYASGYDPTSMATMFEKLMAKNQKKPGFFSRLFTTHPQTPDRREFSLALAARFPEHEEYVINTSEFQRVKARLLRLSNSRVSSKGSIAAPDDNTPGGRPTLKRRTPTNDDPNAKPSEESKPGDPPKLKRNTGDPQQPQQP
jgi:Zn-dependent protease with chaperone function